MGMRANPDPVETPEWKNARAGVEAYYLGMNQLLRDREYIAGQFSYAVAARHTVPFTAEHSNLLAWRGRMIDRPPVKLVVGAMADYNNTGRRECLLEQRPEE